MKSIEEVKKNWKCPKNHDRKHYSFNAENVYCEECKSYYDLGMKKYF